MPTGTWTPLFGITSGNFDESWCCCRQIVRHLLLHSSHGEDSTSCQGRWEIIITILSQSMLLKRCKSKTPKKKRKLMKTDNGMCFVMVLMIVRLTRGKMMNMMMAVVVMMRNRRRRITLGRMKRLARRKIKITMATDCRQWKILHSSLQARTIWIQQQYVFI